MFPVVNVLLSAQQVHYTKKMQPKKYLLRLQTQKNMLLYKQHLRFVLPLAKNLVIQWVHQCKAKWFLHFVVSVLIKFLIQTLQQTLPLWKNLTNFYNEYKTVVYYHFASDNQYTFGLVALFDAEVLHF